MLMDKINVAEWFRAKSPSLARFKEGDLPLLNFSNFTCMILPLFYFRPIHPISWGWFQNWANWIIHKGLCSKDRDWVNSRLGEFVSDLHRTKIRLGKFKAVDSIYCTTWFSLVLLPMHSFDMNYMILYAIKILLIKVNVCFILIF